MQPIGLDAPGRQLDRQCHSIQPPADANDDCGFCIVEIETGAARGGSFDEQLCGWECPCNFCCYQRIVRRAG